MNVHIIGIGLKKRNLALLILHLTALDAGKKCSNNVENYIFLVFGNHNRK